MKKDTVSTGKLRDWKDGLLFNVETWYSKKVQQSLTYWEVQMEAATNPSAYIRSYFLPPEAICALH